MNETLTHTRRVAWGMMVGDGIGDYIEGKIEEAKKEVREELEKQGWKIKSQYFEHECEWGTLITRAEK